MRDVILILLITAATTLVTTGSATAQVTFENTYGGRQPDRGYSVQQTRDGGYIIAGRTESFHLISGDVYLVKTDSLGATLWERTYGGESLDCAWSVEQTFDERYILTGFTQSIGSGLGDVYLIRTDSLGNKLWERTYGGVAADYGFCVQQTSDSGYVVAGQTMSFGTGGVDAYLVKTDSLGDTLWTRTYGDSLENLANSVQQTLDGGYILAGATGWTLTDSMEVYVVKTDSSGDVEWETVFGRAGSDCAYSVRQTSDGGYIIVGQTPFPGNELDVYLIKMDSLGDTSWTMAYGTLLNDVGQCVRETADGYYVIAGMTFLDGPRGADVHLTKADSLGGVIWTRLFGKYGSDWGFSVQETQDSGYVVAGYTESFGAGRADVYLIKTDRYGLTGIHEEPGTSYAVHRTTPMMDGRPNPFRVSTTITFALAEPSRVTLKVFDASGRLVRTLLDQHEFPSIHSPVSVQWDGTDDAGRCLSNGIYFYRLTSPDFAETGRATLIR